MSFNGFVDEFSNAPVQPAFSSYLALDLTGDVVLEWPFQNPNTLYPFSQTVQIINSDDDYDIFLPDATVTSVGQTICFINSSAANIFVVDASGNIQADIETTQSYYLTLTDNGTWVSIQLGATTSSATAASLIDTSTDSNGHQNNGGLSAFATHIKMNQRINTFSGSNYTQASGDRGSLLVWTGGNGTYNCLSAASLGNGYNFSIHNASTVSGIITVTPNGADEIDGGPTFQIKANESATFICNGTSGFYTLGFGQQFTNVVTEAIVPLSSAVADVVTITQEQARNLILNFTGSSGAPFYPDITIALPSNFVNQYYLQNSSTTNDVIVQVGSGATSFSSRIPKNGDRIIGYTDLSNFYNIPNVFDVDSLFFADGSAADPSISFANDITTGAYRNTIGGVNVGAFSITQGGVAVAFFKTGRTEIDSPIFIPSDSNGYSFTSSTTSGVIYNTGTTSVVLKANGVSAVSVNNANVTFTVPIIGTAATFTGLIIGTDATFSGVISALTVNATNVNVTTGSYEQDGINIYSIMRAYG